MTRHAVALVLGSLLSACGPASRAVAVPLPLPRGVAPRPSHPHPASLSVEQYLAEVDEDEPLLRELVGRPIPQILLLHAGAFDAVMMDELLTTLEDGAAVFVPLDAALADPVYGQEPREPKVARGEFFNQIRKARGARSPSLPTLSDTLLALVCR